jgi:hypothetical protein
MVFPLCSEPGSDCIRQVLYFCFDALSQCEPVLSSLENAMAPCCFGRACLIFGSIVNAAADGKRLHAIDAFCRGKPENGLFSRCLRDVAAC